MIISSSDEVSSLYTAGEAPLGTDSQDPFWLAAPAVQADRDHFGTPASGIETMIRSRWTESDLYVLFECPYQTLYLRPDARRDVRTCELWNWDVVELFIGDDWEHTECYKEFQLSPQGEWLDLAIDRNPPDPQRHSTWASGFGTGSSIDSARRVWHGVMRIPFAAITESAITAGKTFRANFYRMEGPPGVRKHIAWRATHSETFHVPSAFGTLVLTI